MSQNFGIKGNTALLVSHCAGMLDLVALPLWVGILVSFYQFDSQQAGGLVTLFLIGAVCASVVIAPRFKHVNRRLVAATGYLIAALCFFVASLTAHYVYLAALHLVAGLSASAALSMAHGAIARSANPHRLFALAGFSLGVLGFIFMGATPNIIKATSGASLFLVFGTVMLIASLTCALAFPAIAQPALHSHPKNQAISSKIPTSVWFGIIGISLMAVTQAMTFSFMERVGAERGFASNTITLVLVTMALINIVAAALAGIFEKRFSPKIVMIAGPVLQIVLANIMMNATSLLFYALSAATFVSLMIFTHTFVFGLLARLDTSGRAMAATPAMLMAGAAIGPVLGGTIVKAVGYPGIGVAALLFGSVALFCFTRVFYSGAATIKSVV